MRNLNIYIICNESERNSFAGYASGFLSVGFSVADVRSVVDKDIDKNLHHRFLVVSYVPGTWKPISEYIEPLAHYWVDVCEYKSSLKEYYDNALTQFRETVPDVVFVEGRNGEECLSFLSALKQAVENGHSNYKGVLI